MKIEYSRLAGGLAFAWFVMIGASAHAGPEARESDGGVYRVSYTSSIEPIEINAMHEWVLHIETPEGDPVESAEITVDGGMPAHNHGLPTAPRVTEYLGGGDYRVQGLRFHMRGKWLVSFDIREADRGDTITFELTL
jgi:hypothetical protein